MERGFTELNATNMKFEKLLKEADQAIRLSKVMEEELEKENRLVSERVRSVFLDMDAERTERREAFEALRRDVSRRAAHASRWFCRGG